MPMSTEVNLPRKHKARFPDSCVVCGAASPSSETTLSTSSLSWMMALFWWWGKRVKITAPACELCGYKLRYYRSASTLVTALVTLFVLTTIWPALEANVPAGLRKWAILGIVLVFCIPFFLVETFWPVAFDITAYDKSIDYEFRNSDDAIEFAMLNSDAEWVKIAGERMPSILQYDDETADDDPV